ncbi:MAG: hypothetical protein RL479_2578, partial [Verrucomicrobiota bacterium]
MIHPPPHRLRLLAAALLPLLFALSFAAQGSGGIAGRITDAGNRLALAGARVTVSETGLTTFADATGDYSLPAVPAGNRTLIFSYVGYAELTRNVTVSAGATASVDVAFGADVVAMDKFVITGSAVGSARALNQQRAA